MASGKITNTNSQGNESLMLTPILSDISNMIGGSLHNKKTRQIFINNLFVVNSEVQPTNLFELPSFFSGKTLNGALIISKLDNTFTMSRCSYNSSSNRLISEIGLTMGQYHMIGTLYY